MATKEGKMNSSLSIGNLQLRWCIVGALLSLFLAANVVPAQTQSVVINEFLASNGTILADEDGDYEDWIELYNPTAEPINLDGYTLTDKPDIPNKWTAPAVTIQPNGFLLIWASNKDRRRVGNWDFDRPLVVKFESAGFHDGDAARILINGKDRSLNLRGLNVVRLDAQGNHIESTVFDTWESTDAADSLIRYLDGVPTGEILIFAIKDEASDQLTVKARSVLAALGSDHIGELGYWDSWGMICVTGQGKILEDYHPSTEGPATGSLVSNMTLHTNFKINKDGEFLGLYTPDGTEIDSGKFVSQVRDVSFGRHPNGSEDWFLFSQPTPSAPNDTPRANAVSEDPVFSLARGFYSSAITLELSSPSGDGKIHYTLDGSEPTLLSKQYVEPLLITKTQVVRAGAFGNGLIPSAIVTRTYFIDEDAHLPVLSLVTDPANLWDDEIGIYAEGLNPAYPNFMQRGRKWERPVSLEFFEEDSVLGFVLDAGIRIHGEASRFHPKKGFLVHFRDSYGEEKLNYPIFSENCLYKGDLTGLRSLILRNSGDDGFASLSRLRDPILQALWSEQNGLVSAKRSVLVFLNGVAWGIYNIREHITSHYLSLNYGVEDADLVKETATVISGDDEHWKATLSFFETNDLSEEESLVHAKSLIDVQNFTDFEIFHIYAANIDLVDSNYVRFRPRSPDGRWKWIMWDADYAFGLTPFNPASHDTLTWETRDSPRPDLGHPLDDGGLSVWSTLILRKLLENEEYRSYFINRFADLLNTTLHPENVVAKIDALAAIIEPDIPQEMARWSSEWGGSLEEWLANVQELRDFAEQRPGFVREHIMDKFGLMGVASLTIEAPSGEGSVRVNSISPSTFPWHGTYFQGVPVTLHAKPAPGYQFAGWSDPSLPTSPTVTISLPEYYEIRASFIPIEW